MGPKEVDRLAGPVLAAIEGAEPFEIPVCIVLEMAGGKICRIDEYLDSDSLTGLLPPQI